MSIQFCEFQDTMFDTVRGITVSACRHPQSPMLHDGVSELICMACKLRKEPSAKSQQARAALVASIPEMNKLKTRPLAERTRILETFCLKCRHCDSVSKVCNGCDCSTKTLVDDYAKYATFHCPLELW